uniref:EF-hand domain-containing protein n=1 Tax=Parastrongyloides trichosuri TaxID=131310 RepID=A0A0N4ZEH7_PARTI
MLGARGVSLGLGKINLSDLNKIPAMDRGQLPRIKKKPKIKSQVKVKKYVDKETLWTACRTVIFGVIIISLGIIMTGLGYFDKELAKVTVYNETITANITYIDNFRRIQFKSMQYIGPVLMGIGSFMLIIACVITLESRDKHTLVIQNEAEKQRKILKEEECNIDEKEKFVEVKETIFLNSKKYNKNMTSDNNEVMIRNEEEDKSLNDDDRSSKLSSGNELSVDIEDLDDECFVTSDKEYDNSLPRRRQSNMSYQNIKSIVDRNKNKKYINNKIRRHDTMSPASMSRRESYARRRSMFNLQGKDNHSISTGNLDKQNLYEHRDLYAELLEDFYKKYALKNEDKDSIITKDELVSKGTNLDTATILIHNVSGDKIQEEDVENN